MCERFSMEIVEKLKVQILSMEIVAKKTQCWNLFNENIGNKVNFGTFSMEIVANKKNPMCEVCQWQ